MNNKEPDLPVNDTPQKTVSPVFPNTAVRKIILLLCSVAVLVVFFLLPANKTWFKDKIADYWNDFGKQRKQLSLEQRKIRRFGTEYTYSKEIADFFEKKGNKKNVLVLVPPEKYFKKYGLNYFVPEPVAFYYFTGLKTIAATDSGATTANWFVTVQENKLHMDSVISITQLKDSVKAFQ